MDKKQLYIQIKDDRIIYGPASLDTIKMCAMWNAIAKQTYTGKKDKNKDIEVYPVKKKLTYRFGDNGDLVLKK